MNVLKKRSFVIETKLPLSFSNKKIIDDNLGEVIVPDGPTKYEYQWFMGVGLNPQAVKRGIKIYMNMWTPYPSQAERYTKDDADAVLSHILLGDAGVYVIEYELSHFREGRQIIIPITAAEGEALGVAKKKEE